MITNLLSNLGLVSLCALTLSNVQTLAHADPGQRKIAVIASGYYESDNKEAKGITDDDADQTKNLLEKHHYDTKWVRQDHQNSASLEFLSALTAVEQELISGKLKRGDQVALFIFSHGKAAETSQDAHRIDFGGVDDLDLNHISSILKKVTDHGVKVALIERSCYAGNSLDLAKTGACVISVQNRFNDARGTGSISNGKYGYRAKGFVTEFRKALEARPDSNFEEAYLKARQSFSWFGLQIRPKTKGIWEALKSLSYSQDLPEISSTEHERLRPIWDHLFFTNLDGDWKPDYSTLVCSKQEAPSQDLKRAVDLSAKAAFGDDSMSYDRFLELQSRRSVWMNEVAQIDQSFNNGITSYDIASVKLNRRKVLTDLLENTENEYERLLGKVLLTERGLYSELYRSLQKSGLPSNPCREFKL